MAAVVDPEICNHAFPTDKNILRYRQVVHHIQFLMNHPDTQFQRFADIANRIGFPFERHRAAVRLMNPGQDFHQRGLSRAVLADKRQYLSSFQIEIDAFERL